MVLGIAGMACASASSSSSGAPDALNQACLVKIRGEKSVIKPRNSHLTCSDITSIIVIVPGAIGEWHLSQGRVCKIYSQVAFPLLMRCQRRSQYFDIVAID